MASSILSSLFGKPYTVGELMNIDSTRMQKASGCSVNLENTWLTVKEEPLSVALKTIMGYPTIKTCSIVIKLNVSSDTGHNHDVFIELDPNFRSADIMNSRIKIYCDCPDFMYRSAYILSKRKSLFENDRTKLNLGQALGDAPNGKTTFLCKHAFAAVQWVMNNYSYIMSTL